MKAAFILALLVAQLCALAATKITVTVVDRKTGVPVTDLTATDFSVTTDNVSRAVQACEFTKGIVDVMMLVDSSLIGGVVTPFATDLIKELNEKEQMAIVAYHSAADLIQDFTSSKDLLFRALGEVKFGNSPRLLDAVFAAAGEGFESASYRRVVLLLTSGVEGPSRVSDREVIRLARRNAVSIFPVYVIGYERSLFEKLARETGGASFNLKDVSRGAPGSPAARIFEVMRGSYTLTVSGNLPVGDNFKVEVAAKKKLFVSALPLD